MRTALVLVLSGLFASCPGFANDNDIEGKPGHGISYLSGGIGEVEQSALKAVQAQYNLQIMFAVKGSREFEVPDRIRIKDGRGAAVLEVPASGPYFYAKLKPGQYQVSARRGSDVVSENVRIDASHGRLLNFAFPPRSGD